MSWLISLLIAGAMFSPDSHLPKIQSINNYTETKNERVIKADENERFEQTYPLTANGRVSISNTNGSITVEGWDRNEVKLEYVKTADTKERLADVQVRIAAQRDFLRVEAEYNYQWNRGGNGSWKANNYKGAEVQFRLMVPRGAVLDEIEAVNGAVNVSNTTNTVKVSAVNGEVKANNISGAAELSTVNGTVSADFDRIDNASRIKLETVNGAAFLTIPSDLNATVRAETTNGKISNDFGLPVRKGKFVGNSLYGKIGDGSVRINLESVNGELALRRKQDGKNQNPVTNLLESKSSDDDDASFDAATQQSIDEAMRQAEKVRVQIPEINAQVQQAMKDAQIEIAKAQVINSKEMQANIKRAMDQQKIAMQSLRDAKWFQGAPSIERKSESFSVKGTPKVTIEARDYAVFVRGWDKSEVQYTVTSISGGNNSQTPPLTVDHSDSEVKIRFAESDSDENYFGGDRLQRIEIFVPRKTDLQINSRREVRLENVSGKLNIQGGEESIDVRDSDGDLSVSASDGKIRVIGFRGAVDAKTGDGLMSLEGDFRNLSAQTDGGTIVLTLPENAGATLKTNSDDVSSEGFSLVRQDSGENGATWKLGNGGQSFSLNSDGKILVRNANLIKSN